MDAGSDSDMAIHTLPKKETKSRHPSVHILNSIPDCSKGLTEVAVNKRDSAATHERQAHGTQQCLPCCHQRQGKREGRERVERLVQLQAVYLSAHAAPSG